MAFLGLLTYMPLFSPFFLNFPLVIKIKKEDINVQLILPIRLLIQNIVSTSTESLDALVLIHITNQDQWRHLIAENVEYD